MKESTSKEKVLKAIRNAQIEAEYQKETIDVDIKASIYPPFGEFPETNFSAFLNASNGQFVYCEDEYEAITNLRKIIDENKYDSIYTNDPDLEHFLTEGGIEVLNYEQGLKKARATVTTCECMVARFGTVVVSSMQTTGRKGHTASEAHIVIAFKDQMVNEISDVYPYLQKKYKHQMPSMITFITGPSRTDVIQGDFLYGVNGSMDLFVLYIDI